MVLPDGPQITTEYEAENLRFARMKTKATNTHSEYVICIAFPLQRWLQEHTLILCNTYICLS